MDEIEIKPTENIKISVEENLCSLKIQDTKMKDAGNYSCHIKNSLGEATCTAGLNVLDDKVKGVPMLPKFLKRVGMYGICLVSKFYRILHALEFQFSLF